MFSLQNIHSLTDFKRNANAYIESIRSTKAPIVLTVNGEAAVVVQDAMVFQDLVDRLKAAEEELSQLETESSSIMTNQIKALMELSPIEKLELIEALWESLSATPEQLPVPDWQKLELDRRKADYQANPTALLSWEEVQSNILNKYG